MQKNLYSVQDMKVDSFFVPFVAQHDAEATRMLKMSLREDSMMTQHPEDFRLFKLGEFNTETGEVIGNSAPVFILNMVDLVNPSKQPTIEELARDRVLAVED